MAESGRVDGGKHHFDVYKERSHRFPSGPLVFHPDGEVKEGVSGGSLFSSSVMTCREDIVSFCKSLHPAR